jgi:hypothetical protein
LKWSFQIVITLLFPANHQPEAAIARFTAKVPLTMELNREQDGFSNLFNLAQFWQSVSNSEYSLVNALSLSLSLPDCNAATLTNVPLDPRQSTEIFSDTVLVMISNEESTIMP